MRTRVSAEGYGAALLIEIGIDEAGYGPTLGPLVVTAWGMSIPGSEDDLWRVLSDAVSRKKSNPGIVVADSKIVYSAGGGIKRLEESVLAFLHASNIRTSTYAGLLQGVTEDGTAGSPSAWHDPLETAVPLSSDAETIRRIGSGLLDIMKKTGVHIEYVSSRVVSPRLFNRSIIETDNKSVTLFSYVASLIKNASYQLGEELGRVTVDNIGSTRYYTKLLEGSFLGWSIARKKETRYMSCYAMTSPVGASFDLRFVKKADSKHFLAALSSMQSKYLREIEMKAFNDFWQKQIPGIHPTAGYPADAKRFISKIRKRAHKLGIPERDFIRTR